MNVTGPPGRLAAHVRVDVRYRDESRFGGAGSSKLEGNMRRLCRPIYRALEKHGPEFVVRHGESLLRRCFSSPYFRAICGVGYPRIPSDVVFPDPDSIAPRGLALTSAETGEGLVIGHLRSSGAPRSAVVVPVGIEELRASRRNAARNPRPDENRLMPATARATSSLGGGPPRPN